MSVQLSGLSICGPVRQERNPPQESGLFPSVSYKASSSEQVETRRYKFWGRQDFRGWAHFGSKTALSPRLRLYVRISSNRRPRVVVANKRMPRINRCMDGMKETYTPHLWCYGETDASIWKHEGGSNASGRDEIASCAVFSDGHLRRRQSFGFAGRRIDRPRAILAHAEHRSRDLLGASRAHLPRLLESVSAYMSLAGRFRQHQAPAFRSVRCRCSV